MKQVLYFFIMLLISANLLAEIQISGVVKSVAGMPIERADVCVSAGSYPMKPMITTTADKDGNYKIILSDTNLQLWINYVAPNHSVLKIPVICLPNKNYVIDVNLSPFYIEGVSDTILVIGDFNNFSKTENTIEMTKLENGIYSAKIPNSRDTLGYQILTSNYKQHTINGQKADFYKPVENFGMMDTTLRYFSYFFDYVSYIVSKEKEIYIEFKPTKGTEQQLSPSIKSDNPAIEKIFQYKDTISQLQIKRDKFIFSSQKKTEDEYDNAKYEPCRKVSSIFASLFAPFVSPFANAEEELKIFLAINYLELFTWGQEYNLKEVDRSIINYLTTNYPLNFFSISNGSFFSFLALECDLNNESLFTNKRFRNYFENIDKKSDEYAWLLSKIVDFYMKKQDTTLARTHYEALETFFPENGATFSIKERYNLSGSKRIVVGNIIPDFELPNVDNPDELISMQKLRGKWVLLDVWDRYCAPCLAEIPNMQVVYEKYKSKGFEIYSISTDSPEELKKFKSNPKYEMPWLHSSVGEGGNKSPVAKLLETAGVPHYILVAPDGKIVELIKLRGSNLDKTLEEFLK
jgi:peroxiredoxin